MTEEPLTQVAAIKRAFGATRTARSGLLNRRRQDMISALRENDVTAPKEQPLEKNMD